jgi:voltage-gated potassium channel
VRKPSTERRTGWKQLPDGRVIHKFEPLMLGLALLVVPVVLVEESHPSHPIEVAAAATNWVIWIGFLIELLFVLWVAPEKRAALRAHWLEVGIVLLTPPFLPKALATLRLARLVRLLRLARLGMLGARALRAERALTSREGFRYIALLTTFLVAMSGAVISLVDSGEFPNVGRGMWWAIVTVTTVGYGDVVPHTVAGRIVASLLMIVGIGFISVLTATVASTFIAHDAEERPEAHEMLDALRRIEERLERIEGQL